MTRALLAALLATAAACDKHDDDHNHTASEFKTYADCFAHASTEGGASAALAYCDDLMKVVATTKPECLSAHTATATLPQSAIDTYCTGKFPAATDVGQAGG